MFTTSTRGRRRPLLILAVGATVGATLCPQAAMAAPAKAATKTFSLSFQVPCDVEYFGSETNTYKMSGTYPASVTPGKSFKVTDITGEDITPASEADAAAALGVSYVVTTTTALDFTALNASPATTNFDAGGYTTKDTVTDGKPIVAPFRAKNVYITATLTPTKSGAVKFQADSPTTTTSTFNAYGSDNQEILANGSVSCKAPSPVVTIFTTTAS